MKIKIKTAAFRVPENHSVNPKKWPTRMKAIYDSKKHYHQRLRK